MEQNNIQMPKIKFKPFKILTFPNLKLRRKCIPVDPTKNLSEIQTLIDQMFKTMIFYKGIGLAAPQIGVGFRVFVVDLQNGKTEPMSFINPKIIEMDGKMESLEGCLSFPQAFGYVERNAKIVVNYLDYNGQEKTLQAEGLLAACIQHEIEHLDGVLFIDKLSRLKKEMILKRFKKIGRL